MVVQCHCTVHINLPTFTVGDDVCIAHYVGIHSETLKCHTAVIMGVIHCTSHIHPP